jgi:exonuclease SbcC
MRWQRIKAHEVGPFRDLDIDLSAIAGKLIAITGTNGAGKSTLLELLAGALYRQCPTRGTLASLARARDSFVDVVVENGHRYTIRQTLDAVSGKGEAFVTDAAGRALLETSKVRDFDAWAVGHLLPESVLFSSSFAPQASAGFVALSKGDRKAVLLRILGIERYERMSAAARAQAGTAQAKADALQLRITEERQRTPDLAEARAAHAEATQAVTVAAEYAAAARAALERLKAAAEDERLAREIADRRRAVEERLARARERSKAVAHAGAKRTDAARMQVADIEERLANNRKVLDQAEQIRGAVAALTEIDREVAAVREQRRQLGTERDAAAIVYREANDAVARAERAKAAAADRVARAEKRLGDRAAVDAAVTSVPALRRQVDELAAEIEDAERERDQLSQRLLGHKDERISRLRGGLQAMLLDAPAATPRAVLDSDDELVVSAEGMPALIDAWRDRAARAQSRLTGARNDLAAAERAAARADEMRAAEVELDSARAAVAEAEAEHARAAAARDEATARHAEIETRATAAAETERATEARRAEHEPLAKRLPVLEQAQTRIDELTERAAQAKADVQRAETDGADQVEEAARAERECEAELATLPPAPSDTPAVDLGAAEARVTETEQAEHRARAEQTRADGRIEQAEAGARRVAELQDELRDVEEEVADCTLLAQSLGRDGIQALEIDAAIPALNTLTNELLRKCFGPRFTVEVRSDRLTADGKRTVESLDIHVLDTKPSGHDGMVETFSGGETVIIAEAISLALTTLACRCAGLEMPTLVRDESGAALAAENGAAYIAMLRLAAEQIGADKVLYVSHVPELQELADARIHISAGGEVHIS